MKKGILAIVAVLFAFSMYAKDIQELVVTTTPPMSCQNCENKIKGNLRFEKGIQKIETNRADQRVTIEYDAEKTNPEQIENAFQKIGYKVDVINPNGECSHPKGECTNSEKNCTNPGGACCQGENKASTEGKSTCH